MRCGTVQELTGIEGSALEIVAIGIDPTALAKFSHVVTSLESSTATPNGIQLVVGDESEVDEALSLIRESGGKLVSINPRRATLEDIFGKNVSE